MNKYNYLVEYKLFPIMLHTQCKSTFDLNHSTQFVSPCTISIVLDSEFLISSATPPDLDLNVVLLIF